MFEERNGMSIFNHCCKQSFEIDNLTARQLAYFFGKFHRVFRHDIVISADN